MSRKIFCCIVRNCVSYQRSWSSVRLASAWTFGLDSVALAMSRAWARSEKAAAKPGPTRLAIPAHSSSGCARNSLP